MEYWRNLILSLVIFHVSGVYTSGYTRPIPACWHLSVYLGRGCCVDSSGDIHGRLYFHIYITGGPYRGRVTSSCCSDSRYKRELISFQEDKRFSSRAYHMSIIFGGGVFICEFPSIGLSSLPYSF